MSALSDALNKANVHSWSTREIARRAGGTVSHTQLGKYLKPVHPQPTDQVLQAFAEVFKIPLGRLRVLAGKPAGQAEPYVPPPEANLLNMRQRRALDEIIRATVADQGAKVAQEAEVLGISPDDFELQYRGDFEVASFELRQLAMELLDRDDPDEVAAYLTTTPGQFIRERSERGARIEDQREAARRGQPGLRAVRQEQDQAAEAPDPDGPDHGA